MQPSPLCSRSPANEAEPGASSQRPPSGSTTGLRLLHAVRHPDQVCTAHACTSKRRTPPPRARDRRAHRMHVGRYRWRQSIALGWTELGGDDCTPPHGATCARSPSSQLRRIRFAHAIDGSRAPQPSRARRGADSWQALDFILTDISPQPCAAWPRRAAAPGRRAVGAHTRADAHGSTHDQQLPYVPCQSTAIADSDADKRRSATVY